MDNEKALVRVAGGTVSEGEVTGSAIDFAQRGFGGLPVTLPKGYDLGKSVKNFCFALPNVKNIEKATRESIFQAAHEYVTQGLDVAKDQCVLIVYGDALTVQKEYFGNKALALRLRPDVAEISNGTIIYEGDEVGITYDQKGCMHVTHKTSFANLSAPIAAAYVVITYKTGEFDTELMTISEIKAAWSMSKNGDSVHKKFPAEMARKTVISRACKKLINSSDDSGILDGVEPVEYGRIDVGGVIAADDETPQPVKAPPEAKPEPKPVKQDLSAELSIRVSYKDYVGSYKDRKAGDYNAADKTITVYPNLNKDGTRRADAGGGAENEPADEYIEDPENYGDYGYDPFPDEG
jgi:recombinational DNA repair protein RecT